MVLQLSANKKGKNEQGGYRAVTAWLRNCYRKVVLTQRRVTKWLPGVK